MRVRCIIAGGREIVDFWIVEHAVEKSGFGSEITEVVSGAARGVDRLGARWAKQRGIPVKLFPAKWQYGRGAGLMRNVEMAGYADALIAIPGQGNGTWHMVGEAKKRGLRMYVLTL